MTTVDVLLGDVSLVEQSRRVVLPYMFDKGRHSVVLARVFAQVDGVGDRIDLVLDSPDGLDYLWGEARLLGRVSHTRAGSVHLSSRTWWQSAPSSIPRDVTLSDLIAVPVLRS